MAPAILDDFRRDFALAPVVLGIGHANAPSAASVADGLRRSALGTGHVLADTLPPGAGELPRLWFPAALVSVSPTPTATVPPPPALPHDALRVLVVTETDPPPEAPRGWDRCLSGTDAATLLAAIADETRAHHLGAIAAENDTPPRPACRISVVVCTYRRAAILTRALASVAAQRLPAAEYEVLVVNNEPADPAPAALVAEAQRKSFADRPDRLRLVLCPFPGLSFARNAGIAQARGEIVSFLDDDAVAPPDWLEQVWATFTAHPAAGVVGGSIILDVPAPRPRWLKPGWEKFWSHRVPRFPTATAVDHWWDYPWGANWSARRRALVAMGGFRTRYGRVGRDTAGGEEIVAACLARALGYAVVVAPDVRVLHSPDLDRFTLAHVWGRTLAARREEFRWQRDGYLPRDMRIARIAREAVKNVGRASLRRGLPAHERLEHLMNACADASMVVPLLRERWASRP